MGASNMISKNKIFLILSILTVIISLSCTTDTTGTGSETDIGTLNAGLYGTIVNNNGTPVESVSIAIIEIKDSSSSIPIDTTYTDSKGYYNISILPSGYYYLEGSISIDTAIYKTLIDTVFYKEIYDSIGLNLGIDTLTLPGAIKGSVSIEKVDKSEILVYIPGTSYIALTDSLGNFIISGIPADSNYSIVYSFSGYLKEMDTSIIVLPNDTTNLSVKNLSFDPEQTPPAPTNVMASLDTNNRIVTINWDTISHPGLAGFIVYRKDSVQTAEEPVKISGTTLTTSTLFNDTLNIHLKNEDTITIQYQVKSQHKETGNKSDYSKPAFIKLTLFNNTIQKMKLIPARGLTFQMGIEDIASPADTSAQPIHNVTFTYDFYIDSTEVTQKEYYDLMNGIHGYTDHEMPSWSELYGLGDNYPAYFINWYDAILYCNALSKSQGLDTVYTYSEISYPTILGPGSGVSLTNVSSDLSVYGYRLPTEAEWEFACRGYTNTDFYWNQNYDPYPENSNDTIEIGSYTIWNNNSGDLEKENPKYGTNAVATKLTNNFSLYDMSGNLYEFCNDFYNIDEYDRGDITDPNGPTSGNYIVMRSGCWKSSTSYLRSGFRSSMSMTNESSQFGFRVCLPKK